MFGDMSKLKVRVSRIQCLRLRLKDKTELCSLKPFVCSAVCFFFSFSLSPFHSSFFPVSEVVVNAFGMTQADTLCVYCRAFVSLSV